MKSWRGVRVLDGVNLAIDAGQRIWVGGRNGAGKTTLLRAAAGLIVPDEGEVRLEGLDPERDRRAFQKRLGFLSAGNSGLYARLTVRDNLEFWAGLAFVPRAERRPAMETVIDRFDLTELADFRVDRLSMGQRQRVRVAGSFLHNPSVVLLDEPETSLDDDGLAAIRKALEDHAAGGGSAIICSPSHERVALGVDTAYVLDGGHLEPQ